MRITLIIAIGLILCSCQAHKPIPGSAEAYKQALEQCRANEMSLIEATAAYRRAVQQLQNNCR